MMNYRYYYIMEYLPKRYDATRQQENDRQVIYDFKNGYCPNSMKEKIVSLIRHIVECEGGSNWRVCFIPASNHLNTIRRYKELSEYISSHTDYPCNVHTISKEIDSESGHLSIKKVNPAENFSICKDQVNNTNIILIDDVITRGRTFWSTAIKLQLNGARQVTGLFLAKTINPDWISHSA